MKIGRHIKISEMVTMNRAQRRNLRNADGDMINVVGVNRPYINPARQLKKKLSSKEAN